MKHWLVKHKVTILVCLLVGFLFVSCLVLCYEKDFVTQNQAASIAYGQALKNCINDNKGKQCLELKLFDVSKSIAGPTDRGPDYWAFAYGFDNDANYTTTVFVDLGGDTHGAQEVDTWYH